MLTRTGYFARETLVSLRRNLLMTLAGILTVTVSLALFGGILLLSKFVDHGTESIKGGVRAEIFMNVDATDQQIADVDAALKGDKRVASFRFLDKKAAYEEFVKLFRKDPDLVENVDPSALPTSFRIVPRKAANIDTLTAAIQRTYEQQPGVDSVKTPEEALHDLQVATDTVKYIFIGLSLALLASSLFLIVNTLRLATFARRREIEVMKLVGASNWFVRVPFMAEGLTQGLVGALLAVGGVMLLKLGFDNWFNDPNGFFGRFFVTSADAMAIAFLMLVIGIGIGLIGSMIGLRRFLRA